MNKPYISKIHHKISWFIAVKILLFVLFYPLITEHYGFHNDWTFIYMHSGFSGHKQLLHPELEHLFFIMRPLNAVLFMLQTYLTTSLQDFMFTRWISFTLLIYISFRVIFHIQKHTELQLATTIFIVLAMVQISGYSVAVGWAASFVPLILNISFSILVYHYIERSFPDGWKKYRYNNQTALAVIFCVSLFLIYPPTLFFPLLFTLIRLLFNSHNALAIAYRDIMIYLTTLGCCLLLSMLLFLGNGDTIHSEKYHLASFSPTGLIKQFESLCHIIYEGFALPIYSLVEPYSSLIWMGIALIGWLLLAWKNRRHTNKWQLLLSLSAVIIIVGMVVSPLLISQKLMLQYRNILVLQSMVWFICITPWLRLGINHKRITATVLVLFIMNSGYWAYQRNHNFVIANQTHYQKLEKILKQANNKYYEAIWFIPSLKLEQSISNIKLKYEMAAATNITFEQIGMLYSSTAGRYGNAKDIINIHNVECLRIPDQLNDNKLTALCAIGGYYYPMPSPDILKEIKENPNYLVVDFNKNIADL